MVSVSRTVASTPEAAWRLISSTGSWTGWGPSVTAVDPPNSTVELGMEGRVRTPVGLWLPFRVTRCEPPHFWAWSVLGVPATTHTVDPVPDGCRISFGAPLVGFPYLIVCRVALRRIAALLEADEPTG